MCGKGRPTYQEWNLITDTSLELPHHPIGFDISSPFGSLPHRYNPIGADKNHRWHLGPTVTEPDYFNPVPQAHRSGCEGGAQINT
jgi:hypothetical protein